MNRAAVDGAMGGALVDSHGRTKLAGADQPVLRLGMRLVKGLRQEDADRIAQTVEQNGLFDSLEDLRRSSGVRLRALRALARADAFPSMGLERQRALWIIRRLRDDGEDRLPMFDQAIERKRNSRPASAERTEGVTLPTPGPLKQVRDDYAAMHLSLKAHPMSFLRDELRQRGVTEAVELKDEARWRQGRPIIVAGLVLVRQRPATANGIIFMTLEDETGIANLIVRPQVFERDRRVARHGVAVMAEGWVERQGQVVHVQVKRFLGLDDRLAQLAATSRNFR
jgi:error-prone DNA polymerase